MSDHNPALVEAVHPFICPLPLDHPDWTDGGDRWKRHVWCHNKAKRLLDAVAVPLREQGRAEVRAAVEAVLADEAEWFPHPDAQWDAGYYTLAAVTQDIRAALGSPR